MVYSYQQTCLPVEKQYLGGTLAFTDLSSSSACMTDGLRALGKLLGHWAQHFHRAREIELGDF